MSDTYLMPCTRCSNRRDKIKQAARKAVTRIAKAARGGRKRKISLGLNG